MKESEVFVYLKGHDFKHEVKSLLKLFFPSSEIVFIEEKALVDNQSLLIENILVEDEKRESITRLIKDGQGLYESRSDIENIDIKVDDEKRITKLGIKTSIYEALCTESQVKVPWGVLTGIRPTKVVHELLDKDIKTDVIREILTGEYLLNIEKANLIINIAIKERHYIYPLDEEKYSLYVSIPFCPTRCLYCSFPSNAIENSRDSVDSYTEKLIFELSEMSKIMSKKTIDTVYIGGGTPTAIPILNLERIIKSVYEYFGTDIREFTVEAGRPDTIDIDVLEMLKRNNIKRISINPQTMNSDTLKTIGRDHTVRDIVNTFKMARRVGFESINMDIILGLPGENEFDVIRTMEYIKELKPENLTVHTMSVKRTSNLKKDIEQYSLAGQTRLENMLNITKEYARDLRLHPYYMYRQNQTLGNFENVGYSEAGHECIYNMLIMEEKQTIIAVGAGGTSKIYNGETGKVSRVPNVKNLSDYINRVNEMVEKKRSELDVNKSTKRN